MIKHYCDICGKEREKGDMFDLCLNHLLTGQPKMVPQEICAHCKVMLEEWLVEKRKELQ